MQLFTLDVNYRTLVKMGVSDDRHARHRIPRSVLRHHRRPVPQRPAAVMKRSSTHCSCGKRWAVTYLNRRNGGPIVGYWCHLCDGNVKK